MSEGQGGKPNIVKMTENWDSTGELEISDSKAPSVGADTHANTGDGGHSNEGDHGGRSKTQSRPSSSGSSRGKSAAKKAPVKKGPAKKGGKK